MSYQYQNGKVYLSRDKRFPTMWYMYMQPANAQTSLRIRAVWPEHLQVAWIFYTVKLLTKHHFKFICLTGGCTGLSESTLVKMPHCCKSHVAAQRFKHQSKPCLLTFLHVNSVGSIFISIEILLNLHVMKFYTFRENPRLIRRYLYLKGFPVELLIY